MSSGKVGDPVIHAETGAPAGATYILHPPRSFGARLGRFFSRLFVLSFVAVAGFGGGYAFNEREGLLARQDLLATISTIEKQVLQAETIREARDAHSMTIEVDMASVMAELRLELAKVAQARVAAASGRLASALVHDGESAVDAKPGSLVASALVHDGESAVDAKPGSLVASALVHDGESAVDAKPGSLVASALVHDGESAVDAKPGSLVASALVHDGESAVDAKPGSLVASALVHDGESAVDAKPGSLVASALVHDGESAVDAKPGSLGKPLGFDLRELPTTHGSIRPAQEPRQSAPPAIGSLRVHPDDVASTGPAATARLTVEDDVTIPQQAENSLPIR